MSDAPSPDDEGPEPPPARGSWWSLALVMALVLGSVQGWAWWQGQRTAKAILQWAQPGDIVLYTTSTCTYCEQARQWLQTHQVPWRDCPIESDARCQAAFASQGAPGVPLLAVKGQWRMGFDQNWVAQALQSSGQAANP